MCVSTFAHLGANTGAQHGHDMKREDWGMVKYALLEQSRKVPMDLPRYTFVLL